MITCTEYRRVTTSSSIIIIVVDNYHSQMTYVYISLACGGPLEPLSG